MKISPGMCFGQLVVSVVSAGAKDAHALAVCECSCGNIRTARHTDLRRGVVDCCAPCALRRAWQRRDRPTAVEMALTSLFHDYRANARRRGLSFDLTRDQFRALVAAACRYCGQTPAGGVDRTDSGRGYIVSNVVPCCSFCNYAKRDLPLADFLGWIARLTSHQRGAP